MYNQWRRQICMHIVNKEHWIGSIFYFYKHVCDRVLFLSEWPSSHKIINIILTIINYLPMRYAVLYTLLLYIVYIMTLLLSLECVNF